jgi:glycosyltransferase involved in cell wall biosynthesis
MRITIVSPTAAMSGGVKVIVIYAQRLRRMGHTVCIVFPPPRTILFRQKVKSLLRGNGWPDDSLSGKPYVDMSGVDHLVLERWRPVVNSDVPDADVVIATWWETAEWVNALSASKGAKVYFIQGHEVFPNLPIARSRATYQLPMHKIVVSRWLERIMSSEYGENVMDLVPNSVDRAQFYASVRGKQAIPTVGLLYSTGYVKGLDVALSALESVQEHIPNLRIISFGSERQISGLKLPERTEFFFYPPQDQIRNLYSQCDVWITASRSEGFNLPAMEAMACRTPVVATRAGWPEEAVKTGWNGVLVNIDDRGALAHGIKWVLSQSDGDWRNLSANAYATVASASWETSAALFEKALEHACSRSARGEIAGTCSTSATNEHNGVAS